jgi:hypothetical protein
MAEEANEPRSLRRVGVWGAWHGGPNYAMSADKERFNSISHAKGVMRSRIAGHDPISGLQTPVVQDSEMMLYDTEEADYPFTSFKQTKRGIRREAT